MVQVRKQSHTPDQIDAVATSFHEIGARLEVISTLARQKKLKKIELKLGTLTGAMYQRMLDSLDTVEADARKSIRKQTKD